MTDHLTRTATTKTRVGRPRTKPGVASNATPSAVWQVRPLLRPMTKPCTHARIFVCCRHHHHKHSTDEARNRVWVALATGRAPSAPSITQMPGTKAPDIAPYEKRGCSLPRHLHDGAQCAAYRNPLPGVGTPSKTVIAPNKNTHLPNRN